MLSTMVRSAGKRTRMTSSTSRPLRSEVDIQQQHVHRMPLELGQPVAPVAGFVDNVKVRLLTEDLAQAGAKGRVVVDDE